MNHAHPLQTLSFRWVVYPVKEISKKWLDNPAIDYFVFTFYLQAVQEEALPIQLCAFAFSDVDGCGNPDNPDILGIYENDALAAGGPLQLSSNQVQAQPLRDLLAGGSYEWLLFIPNLDLSQRIFYSIFGLTSGAVLSGGSVNTNPSPPATL